MNRAFMNSTDCVYRESSQNRVRSQNLWRSNSLITLVRNSDNQSPVFESAKELYKNGSAENSLAGYKNRKPFRKFTEFDVSNNWDTIVTVVLVGAKGLPPAPSDSAVHELYCKFRLGSETFKSKSILHIRQPEWRERFKLHLHKDHLLNITLWDKGKQKIFMGSCVLDLSKFDKERTHEILQQLDDGFGVIHLFVTMCVVRYVTTPQSIRLQTENVPNYSIFNLKSNWKLVGSLHMTVIRARGLSGKPSAYCTLELDNERLQTHKINSSAEPVWNKSYVFNVYDVTSVLDLKVYGSSLPNPLLNEFLGQVYIPLLRIKNGETCWYALKSRNKRSIAKGNCPRILLRMNIQWDPIKAALRLFRPKEVKYIEKQPSRLDIALLFRNLAVFADFFSFLTDLNEVIKRVFEWNNRDISAIALLVWLIFCYHLRPWAVPLLLLPPFCYYWIRNAGQCQTNQSDGDSYTENAPGQNYRKDDKKLTDKINDFQDLTTTVTQILDGVISFIERIKNLFKFKVPFLSYVVMISLLIISALLYIVPFNYLLMLFGVYKFVRKYLNPNRILNNDLLDFISRIPDNRILKDWKELSVPEPH